MKANGRLWLTATLTFAMFCSPSRGVATQPEVTCPVSVYAFIDVSISLNQEQIDNLRKGFKGLLSANNSPFPNETKVYLIPFAGKVDFNSLKAHVADLNELDRSFTKITSLASRKKMVGLQPTKTDLREVLSTIFDISTKKRIPEDQDPRLSPYTVFVIASDFVHDPENEPAHLEANLRSWQIFFDNHNQKLFHELFAAGANQALLLLNAQPDINSVSLGVLTDLTEAGDREKERGQVGSFSLVEGNPFDNALFISYIKPLDVTIERKRSVATGGAQLEIKVHNRSCLHIGKLGLLKYDLNVQLKDSSVPRPLKDGGLREISASRDWVARATVKREDVEAKNLTANQVDDSRAAYVAEVVIPTANPKQHSVLGSTSVATKDSLFISAFRGTLEERLFHADLQMQGSLADAGQIVLQLSLFSQQGGAVAEKELPIKREEVARGVTSFTFKLPYDEIENICYHGDYRPALRILSKTPGILEEEQDGKTFELEPDGRSDGDHLLQEIFEQASLPAAIAAVLTFFLVLRRFDEIEKVEKVMAVIALMATTVMVLLHRLTRIEDGIDGWMLTPSKVRLTAVVTISFIFLTVIGLVCRGGLPLAKTDETLLAEISFRYAHRRRWGQGPAAHPIRERIKRILGRWGRLIVLSGLVFGATMAIFLICRDTQRKMNCAFGFIEYQSSSGKY